MARWDSVVGPVQRNQAARQRVVAEEMLDRTVGPKASVRVRQRVLSLWSSSSALPS
jgi:hypothetical protein